MEPRVEYVLRPGFVPGAPISVVGARIESIKKRHATVENPQGYTVEDEIIEDARPDDSPLHPCFVWDANEALRQVNRQRARYLSRCYEVHIIREDRQPIVISPASVVVGGREDRRIVSPLVATYQPDDFQRVLRETLNLLRGVQARLAKLNGLSATIGRLVDGLIVAIDREIKRKENRRVRQEHPRQQPQP